MDEQQPNPLHPTEPPIEIEKFLPDLEELDMTEEEKIEFLYMLADIMKRFVDLGFGEDSVSIIEALLTNEAIEENTEN